MLLKATQWKALSRSVIDTIKLQDAHNEHTKPSSLTQNDKNHKRKQPNAKNSNPIQTDENESRTKKVRCNFGLNPPRNTWMARYGNQLLLNLNPLFLSVSVLSRHIFRRIFFFDRIKFPIVFIAAATLYARQLWWCLCYHVCVEKLTQTNRRLSGFICMEKKVKENDAKVNKARPALGKRKNDERGGWGESFPNQGFHQSNFPSCGVERIIQSLRKHFNVVGGEERRDKMNHQTEITKKKTEVTLKQIGTNERKISVG